MPESLDPRVKVVVLLTTLAIAFACSGGSDGPESDDASSAISEEEALANMSRYLDSLEGPPILLWDDVGAPAFSPQSCAEFVGFVAEENTPLVRDEGDGIYLISLTDTRQQSGDETYQWRFDPQTGKIASLQMIC